MGRSKAIVHLKDGERQIMQAVYKTGMMRIEDARKHFEVSDRRFRRMYKEGWIKKDGNLIRLDTKGQKYAEQKMGLDNPYRSKPSQWKHDLKLNQVYLSRSPSERNSWKTETKMKDEILKDANMKNRYFDLQSKEKWKSSWTDYDRKNFVPDGAYYSETEGCYVVVEVVTVNYSQQDLEQKQAFVQEFYNGKFHGGSMVKA